MFGDGLVVFMLGQRDMTDYPLVSGETPTVRGYEDVCQPTEPCPYCPAPK